MIWIWFWCKIEYLPKGSGHLATLEPIQNKLSTDFSLGTSFVHSFKFIEPQAVQWAKREKTCMMYFYSLSLMKLSCVSPVLKMNKLSTYKLCTYDCPGFTGCVLQAAYKYLSSIISRRLTATTASGFSSPLFLLPTSRALAAVAMTTRMKSLGTFYCGYMLPHKDITVCQPNWIPGAVL